MELIPRRGKAKTEKYASSWLWQLINADAAAEDAHHFARILRGLWFAPFTDFGVAETVEVVNGAIDDFGRTDDQDFEGDSVGF